MKKTSAWIVGVHELTKEYPDEDDAIESGKAIASKSLADEASDVSWIRWTGNSRFRRRRRRMTR